MLSWTVLPLWAMRVGVHSHPGAQGAHELLKRAEQAGSARGNVELPDTPKRICRRRWSEGCSTWYNGTLIIRITVA